jgi:hypothetical protein
MKNTDYLSAIGHKYAIKIGRSGNVIDKVKRSEKGVYCLMCLEESYGMFWTSIDNGTWYCEIHRKILRDNYTNKNT